jgi:hypothetical protein
MKIRSIYALWTLDEKFFTHRNLFILTKSFNTLFSVYCHVFFELRSLGDYYMLAQGGKTDYRSVSGSNLETNDTELKLVFFLLKKENRKISKWSSFSKEGTAKEKSVLFSRHLPSQLTFLQ